jgi:hypothetical protein
MKFIKSNWIVMAMSLATIAAMATLAFVVHKEANTRIYAKGCVVVVAIDNVNVALDVNGENDVGVTRHEVVLLNVSGKIRPMVGYQVTLFLPYQSKKMEMCFARECFDLVENKALLELMVKESETPRQMMDRLNAAQRFK